MSVRDVRALSNAGPPLSANASIMPFRCCGESPSGPPAEPFGKERMALAIVSSEIEGERPESSGSGGSWESGCGGGCFS